MKAVILLICSLIGYLFGSIPTSIVIGKIFFKKDIREYGSKNAGGTNAGRVFGKKVGLIVIIIDIIKTIIPIIAAYFICKYTSLNNYGVTEYAYQFSAIFCVIGHCFPIFAQFKGGKGVSSFAAIIFCTNWLLTIIGLCIFFLVLKLKKYVSLSSIFCALILPIIALVFAIVNLPIGMYYASYSYFYTLTIAISGILLIIMHRSNIKRLINHEERKIKWM